MSHKKDKSKDKKERKENLQKEVGLISESQQDKPVDHEREKLPGNLYE